MHMELVVVDVADEQQVEPLGVGLGARLGGEFGHQRPDGAPFLGRDVLEPALVGALNSQFNMLQQLVGLRFSPPDGGLRMRGTRPPRPLALGLGNIYCLRSINPRTGP